MNGELPKSMIHRPTATGADPHCAGSVSGEQDPVEAGQARLKSAALAG